MGSHDTARCAPSLLRFLSGAVAATAALLAQAGPTIAWHSAVPVQRLRGAAAFDAARGRTVQFGGMDARGACAETWDFDGVTWRQRFPRHVPTARTDGDLAYDSVRQRIVMFGGRNGVTDLDDTWEWDGTDWLERIPAVPPRPRHGHALAYDRVRGETVLFGGTTDRGQTAMAETWTWDGVNWRALAPATAPPGRMDHRMAFDRLRGRTVLFGGRDPVFLLGDTWEWDGIDWRRRTPTHAPDARHGFAMTWDVSINQTLLYSGFTGSSVWPSDGWRWDGSDWSTWGSAGNPPGSAGRCLVHDEARSDTLLLGAGIWSWSGAYWSEFVAPPGPAPEDRQTPAFTWDEARHAAVLFGGGGWGSHPLKFGDTWLFDGRAWRDVTDSESPSARDGVAMAYDSLRQVCVLFGGADRFGGSTNETWELRGVEWTMMQPPGSPPPVNQHAMVFDPARGRTLLVAADGSAQVRTWEWDGQRWTARQPAHAPAQRWGHALAYDLPRQRAVLFGGGDGLSGPRDDTWEWDGSDWQQLAPAVRPSPRVGHAMAYDPGRQRVLLTGGYAGGIADPPLADTWEWDGTRWEARGSSPNFAPRFGHRMAYDPDRGRMLLTGGADTFGIPIGLWALTSRSPAAYAVAGPGCPGSYGLAAFAPEGGSLPWLGDTLRLRLAPVPPASVALAVLGASDAQWGELLLPLDLGPFGMPDCMLRNSVDATVPLPTGAGVATLALALPPAMEMVGVPVFTQALIQDPAANPAGLIVSHAGVLRAGVR